MIMKTFYSVLILVVMLVGIFTNGPSIETYLHPVTANVELEKIEARGEDSVVVWVSFTKERQCTFKGLAWYYFDPLKKHHTLIPHVFLDDIDLEPESRPVGKQVAGPWLIRIPLQEIDNIVGYTKHKCHPFWDTITQFYP